MDILHRNNVVVTGNPDGRAVVLAHGFGCDQNLWRLTVPALAPEYRVVLFDYVGSGRSDQSAFDEARYSSLDGYADDVAEVCAALDLHDAVIVGHSVSAMIGVLAAQKAPERFDALVLVAPSPCYIDDGAYHGGFSVEDIDELLSSLESNYLGWSASPRRPFRSRWATRRPSERTPSRASRSSSTTLTAWTRRSGQP